MSLILSNVHPADILGTSAGGGMACGDSEDGDSGNDGDYDVDLD